MLDDGFGKMMVRGMGCGNGRSWDYVLLEICLRCFVVGQMIEMIVNGLRIELVEKTARPIPSDHSSC